MGLALNRSPRVGEDWRPSWLAGLQSHPALVRSAHDSLRRPMNAIDFWDIVWLLVWSCFLIVYLLLLVDILRDLFGDEVSGWSKALWVTFLFFFPFLGAIVYLIARGDGMAERLAGVMRR